MDLRNPFRTSLSEPFVTGCDNLSPLHHRLCKVESAVILFCRQGKARITIDLLEYKIVPHTFIFLLPNNIVEISAVSEDLQVTYFACSDNMFLEATFRFNPQFFRFIKENPCKEFPSSHIEPIEGLMKAAATVYADPNHCFRNEIVKNLFQIWLMDLYDKVRRRFTPGEEESRNRQEEVLKKFIPLIHTYCTSEREVQFYANRLCISTKYLSDITNAIIGKPAKKLIDEFVLLEIKVLLQNTDLPVQTIGERLNFPDQSYFGRYFKRHTGISPSEYRERFRK